MYNLKLTIYIVFFTFFYFSHFVCSINEAPAKVTIRVQVSKLNQDWVNDSRMTLCVDKGKERCFWAFKDTIIWDGEQYKDIQNEFFISNMAIELTIDVKIEHLTKKIDYPRKIINLKKLDSKTSFEMHSFNLESFITVAIDQECELGYYPPRQCTKACFPMPSESECDSFGNKICKKGLQYDEKVDRCITNNCLKSNIQCVNGRCVDKAGSAECVCHENYYGKYCQNRNHCYPNPCLNGGQCIADLVRQTYTCSCQSQFTDTRCQKRVTDRCQCPENTKCQFSKSGILESCSSEIDSNRKDIFQASSVDSRNNRSKTGGLESRKMSEWYQVSLTTTIVVAIGCIMLILCVSVSLYVFYKTRENKTIKRVNRLNNSPSALYSGLSPKSIESTFKRSLSLDDNSAYIPSNSQILQTLPNSYTMSSTGYSLHTNSYRDNSQSSPRHFPVQGGYIYSQEHPITPLIIHHNYPIGSLTSTTSDGSLSIPPLLPPRSNETELSPFGLLPNPE